MTMFERSLRMLPPPTPSRDIYNNRASQHHHHHQRPRSEPVPHQYEEPERTGECMVILPESQSAFRAPNSSAPGKCDCTSFYSIPGSVACLCGHSMAHHRPAAEASPSSPSTNSPYLAPLASFAAAAAAASHHHHNPSLAPTSASALNASSGNVHHHSHRNTLPTLANENVSDAIAGMMARVSKLEQMLTSSMHAHQALAESHRNLQTAHSRLTAHCAGISQKLDLMVAKSGDAAREALEVEILQQRQHKMAGELERLGQAVETLDERTEELEFRSEDVEKWVDEEKKVGKRGDSHCGGCSCEREAKDMERHQHHQHHHHHHHQHQHQQHQPQHSSHHTHPLDGSSDSRRRYAHAVTADSSASSSPSTSPRETSLPSPAPSASSSGGKRKRSHSDATTTSPPSWALPSPASSPSIVAGVAIREGKRLLQSF